VSDSSRNWRRWGGRWALVVVAALAAGVPVLADARPAGLPDLGTVDAAYGTSVTAPTMREGQSKLWVHDGAWWGVLFDRDTGAFQIHRLEAGSRSWVATGVAVDGRGGAGGVDALWDGATLYTLSHVSNGQRSGMAELRRFAYDADTATYRLDLGPIPVNGFGTEQAVIAKDSTGVLWVTFTQGSRVYVTRSLGDDAEWAPPFALPVAGVAISDDDVSAVVAFGTAIGVLWSNQVDHTMYFAVHADGAPDEAWTVEVAYRIAGRKGADDHISLKADAGGRVYAAAKTSLTRAADPLIHLLVREPDETWASHPFGTVADGHTRPIVQLDEEAGWLYLFATAPCCSGGTIHYKRARLDAIAFPPGLGTPFIRSGANPAANNATSTKQPTDRRTGLVVLASDDSTRRYLHNRLSLDGAVVGADLNLRAGPGAAHDAVLVMPAGATVEVTGGRANGFVAVVYAGTPGWAAAAFLLPDDTGGRAASGDGPG